MAMEYFDEKIAPGLRLYPASPNRLNSGYFSGIFSSGTGFSLSMRYSDSLSPPSTPLCRLPLNQAVSEPVPRLELELELLVTLFFKNFLFKN